jgi:hypothetical protein
MAILDIDTSQETGSKMVKFPIIQTSIVEPDASRCPYGQVHIV